jgi:predicted ester cyclase
MIKTLSTEERVAIARDYLAQVFNGQNAERARQFFTPDVVWHGGALGTVTGVDTIVPVLGGFIGALTGIKSEVQDVIASKDLVALRLVVSATHTGNLLGIPATGRRVQWDAVDIYRVRDDGKISDSGRSRTWLRSSANWGRQNCPGQANAACPSARGPEGTRPRGSWSPHSAAGRRDEYSRGDGRPRRVTGPEDPCSRFQNLAIRPRN